MPGHVYRCATPEFDCCRFASMLLPSVLTGINKVVSVSKKKQVLTYFLSVHLSDCVSRHDLLIAFGQ